jgi:hypothetical protein
VAAVVLALGAIAAGQTTAAEASPGSIGLLAVDMDIGDNSISSATDSDGDGTADTEATSLGTIEDCAQIASGGTIQVDIVVQGYPTDHPLVGYDITLNYDPAVANVTGTAFDTFTGALGDSIPELRTLISADPQSSPIFEVDEEGESISLPDKDGQFAMAVLDLAPGPDPDEDVDGEEVSDGLLARIQLTGVGPGQTDLSLTTDSTFVIDDDGEVRVDLLNWGFLSVDQACVPGEQPPPPPTGGSPGAPGAGETPQPGAPGASETPQPGAPGAGETPEPGTAGAAGTPQPGAPGAASTPQPGTPGADTQADGQPRTGIDAQTPGPGTPGPGTPVLGGTPVTGDEGGSGGEAAAEGESDGGGLSAGAWAGIAAGIAAAAVAASGAGWFALRRRRARGTPTSGGEAGSE